MNDPIATIEPRRRGRRSGHSFGRVVRVLVLWTVAWWAALGLVIRPGATGGWIALAAAASLSLVVPLMFFARAMDRRLYPGAAIRVLVFRPFWYLQLLLPLVVVGGALGAIAGLPLGVTGAAARYAAAATAALLTAVGVLGWVGSRRLVTHPLVATFPDLPDGLDGLRIVQLSDLHVGPHTSPRHLAAVVAATHDMAPDLVVFTGDQVDDYARDVDAFARAFADLQAPLGVFAIPGNHDVYAGWTAVREGLEDAGLRVLVNKAVELRRGGASFWLAGIGDPAGRGFVRDGGGDAAPDVEGALSSVPPAAFVLALAHNPVLWPELAGRDVPLTLSGHTHHGQLSVPRLSWSLASPFLEHAMGIYQVAGSLLYISPGTNYWGLPFRIGALPEVTVIELSCGEGPALRSCSLTARPKARAALPQGA